MYDITRAREMCGKSLLITIDNQAGVDNLTDSLQATLLPFREGLVTVELEYINQAARTLIRLGDDWKVSPSDELLSQLSILPAVSAVKMTYNG